jgi:catechol 2,3-dioxygenase-like lactoylglutathione lyase family enzyme
VSRPRPDRFDQARRDRQAQIYSAVLRQYLTTGDASVSADHRFPQVFVLDHTVEGAGASGGVPGDGPIPADVRRAITGALAEVGPLTFVASDEEVLVAPCARVRDDGILVTLGPVNGAGDQVQVGVHGHMGCLGANSLTYEVQQTSSGWRVGGIAAMGPVA